MNAVAAGEYIFSEVMDIKDCTGKKIGSSSSYMDSSGIVNPKQELLSLHKNTIRPMQSRLQKLEALEETAMKSLEGVS